MCCIFEQTTCGGTVTENCTYVQNPGYPTAYNPGTAVITCQASLLSSNFQGVSKRSSGSHRCHHVRGAFFLDQNQKLNFLSFRIMSRGATRPFKSNMFL